MKIIDISKTKLVSGGENLVNFYQNEGSAATSVQGILAMAAFPNGVSPCPRDDTDPTMEALETQIQQCQEWCRMGIWD